MTVPGRVEAASLLPSLDPLPSFVPRVRGAAGLADWSGGGRTDVASRDRAADLRLVGPTARRYGIDTAAPGETRPLARAGRTGS